MLKGISLPFLLSLTAVLASVSVVGAAVDVVPGKSGHAKTPLKAREDVQDGICGEGCSWTFSGSTLTISGSGSLSDCNPFNDFSDDVETVVIENGIKEIAYGCFSGFSKLSQVTIPDSVQKIGEDAFSWCSSLTSISIPDSVTRLESYLFYYSSLSSVTLPNGLTYIGEGVFSGCSDLNSLLLPDSLTVIENYAFEECGSSLFKKEGNAYYMSSATNEYFAFMSPDDCNEPFTINSNSVILAGGAFAQCALEQPVTIPDSVISIGSEAFYGSKFESITLGNNIQYIGASAFQNCRSLVSITIPNGITSIKSLLFAECKNLTSVTISNSVSSIEEYAFSDCSSLTSIDIPNKVTRLETGVFSGCTSLSSVTIPNSVFYIARDVFSLCSSLSSIDIPDSVSSIGEKAFSGCSSLTSIDIPNKVTRLEPGVFSGCTSLSSVIIPNSVFYIASEVFSGCSSLSSIDIPDSVYYIGKYAFKQSNLSSVKIPNSVTVIKTGLFVKCTSLSSVNLPNNIKFIGEYAFSECSSLESISIPDTVTSIGRNAFDQCPESLFNADQNGLYVGNNDNPYFAFIKPSSCEAAFTINSNPKIIANYAFSNCKSSLTSVTIPESVEFIGDYAFDSCSLLTSVTIPNSVVYIGENAFGYCESLASVTIPDSVLFVERNAFIRISDSAFTIENNMKYLGNNDNPYHVLFKVDCDASDESLAINANTKVIAAYADYACSETKTVAFPQTLVSVGRSAFGYCRSLQSVTIPDSILYVGNSAFDSISASAYQSEDHGNYLGNEDNPYLVFVQPMTNDVTSLTFNPNTKVISGSAFYFRCKSLSSVVIPESVKSIGSYAFGDCTHLTEVQYSGLSDPGKYVYDSFESCDFRSVIVPDEYTDSFFCEKTVLKSVSGECGLDCSWILTPTGQLTVTGSGEMKMDSIEWANFSSRIKEVVIGEGISSIEDSAFNGCDSLASVTISVSVTSIGNSTFEGCSSLTSLTIPESVNLIGNSTFKGCSSLASIAIPESVTSIEDSTFDGCDSLASVSIPDSVTSIGNSAFKGCSSLTSLTVPESVTSFGDDAFDNCPESLFNSDQNGLYLGNNDNQYHVLIKPASDAATFAINSNTKVIANKAFSECPSLTSVSIPESVTSIGNSAFKGCSSLTSVTIPDSVTSIGDDAFDGCPESLFNADQNGLYLGNNDNQYHVLLKPATCEATFTINANTDVIAIRAFKDCTLLASIVIPESVTSIGSEAFYGCTSLSDVQYLGLSDPGKNSSNVFYSCPLEEVTVPAYYTDESFCGITVAKEEPSSSSPIPSSSSSSPVPSSSSSSPVPSSSSSSPVPSSSSSSPIPSSSSSSPVPSSSSSSSLPSSSSSSSISSEVYSSEFSSSQSPVESSSSSEDGPNTGFIVAIVIVCLVFAAIICLAVYCCIAQSSKHDIRMLEEDDANFVSMSVL